MVQSTTRAKHCTSLASPNSHPLTITVSTTSNLILKSYARHTNAHAPSTCVVPTVPSIWYQGDIQPHYACSILHTYSSSTSSVVQVLLYLLLTNHVCMYARIHKLTNVAQQRYGPSPSAGSAHLPGTASGIP